MSRRNGLHQFVLTRYLAAGRANQTLQLFANAKAWWFCKRSYPEWLVNVSYRSVFNSNELLEDRSFVRRQPASRRPNYSKRARRSYEDPRSANDDAPCENAARVL